MNVPTTSIDKGSKKAEKKQEKQSVFDKAKEIADKEEKKRKARLRMTRFSVKRQEPWARKRRSTCSNIRLQKKLAFLC